MTEWEPRAKRWESPDLVVTESDRDAEFTQPEDIRDTGEFPTQRVDEYDAASPTSHEQEAIEDKPDRLRRAIAIGVTTLVLAGGIGGVVKYFSGKKTGSEPVATAPSTPGQTEPATAETTTTQPKSETEANINPLTPVEMGGKIYVLEDAQKRAFVPQQEAPTAKAAANEIDSVYNNFAKMKSGNELTGDDLVEQNRAILNKMFEGREDIDPASKQLLINLNEIYSRDGEYPDFKLSGGTFDPTTGTLSGATMKVTKYKRDKSGYEEAVKSFSYPYTGTTKLNSTTQFWNYVAKSPFPMSEYTK